MSNCADCGQPVRFYQRQVFIADDFIVHQSCLDQTEAEWQMTKKALIADGHDVDNCNWHERYIKKEAKDG